MGPGIFEAAVRVRVRSFHDPLRAISASSVVKFPRHSEGAWLCGRVVVLPRRAMRMIEVAPQPSPSSLSACVLQVRIGLNTATIERQQDTPNDQGRGLATFRVKPKGATRIGRTTSARRHTVSQDQRVGVLRRTRHTSTAYDDPAVRQLTSSCLREHAEMQFRRHIREPQEMKAQQPLAQATSSSHSPGMDQARLHQLDNFTFREAFIRPEWNGWCEQCQKSMQRH